MTEDEKKDWLINIYKEKLQELGQQEFIDWVDKVNSITIVFKE